ncbi:MAG: type I-E CRISPR-associated protein Cas7/Cse4/CasC [Hungatella sp.]|jgi:CRISPR system Cascade subunit CasC|nr:type I-E CRISPR-associated protein Cas7/Cse4/CasC [Hungatella sp.]
MSNKENPFRNFKVEYHILQSFPVSCLNRDDVGAPKTAIVGGTNRARVSSQCWKRQVRLALHDFDISLAIRTKHIDTLIGEACLKLGARDDAAKGSGETIAAALTKDTLHFISVSEVNALAEYAKEKSFDKSKIDLKEVIKIHKKAYSPAVDGLDIALFGRMVAQAAELNVEAAASFSHAISTHKVTNEVEFFTALDDFSTDQGSAHMGSLEFNSATYYRYISLDLGQLYDTLGDGEFISKAIEAFTKALYIAVPSARQTTQSGASPWEYAKILVRRGQRLQVPFETAIKQKDGGFLNPSIEFLKEYIGKKEKLSGSLFGKINEFDFGEDDSFSIDHLIAGIQKAVQV